MKKLVLLSLLFLTTQITLAQTTKNVSVFFDVDRHQLSEEAVNTLDKLIGEIKYYHINSISLTAHTDHDASDEYNIALSKRRANTVEGYLKSQGLNRNYLQSTWHGEQIPIANNSTTEGKQLNRRVEITIDYHPYSNVDEVLEDLKEKPQHFELQNDGETNIIGEEGVKITFPEDAFMRTNGEIVHNSVVRIELEESLDAGESFINQLSTESNGEMLESGGMLRVDAYLGSEKLVLRPNKKINIGIPNSDVLDEMTVFTGDRRSDGVMVWNNTNEPFDPSRVLIAGAPLQLDTMPFYEYIDYNLDITRNYNKALLLDIPIKPEKPRVPTKPYKPQRPDPDEVVSGLAKIFTSKKGREKIADDKYAELMKRYEERMQKYDRQMNVYHEKVEHYNELVEVYNKELTEFEDKLAFHIDFLTERFNEVKSVYDQKRLNYAIFRFCAQAKLQSVRTTNPLAVLQQFATNPIQDQYYHELVQIAHYHNLYLFLAKFEPEYIQKHFLYNGKLKTYRMKRKGYNTARWTNLSSSIYSNVKYNAMITGEEIPTLLDAAVARKKREDKIAGIVTSSDVSDFYQTATQNMGWINCDRFSRVNRNRMVSVGLSSAIAARMMVYIKKFKSLMSGNAGMVSIPKNTKIKAIFITTIDGKPHLSIQEAKPEGNMGIKAEYKPMSLEEIQEEMQKL